MDFGVKQHSIEVENDDVELTIYFTEDANGDVILDEVRTNQEQDITFFFLEVDSPYEYVMEHIYEWQRSRDEYSKLK